jgi:hypothetical protein
VNYTNVTNPKWSNKDNTTIDCEVTFENLGTVPFTANPLDTSNPSSKQIFDECVSGNYGVINEWTPPTTEQLSENARAQRNALLDEVDSIVSNPLRWASFSTEQQATWANYRQTLLDVPQQNSFPNTIIWPIKPNTVTLV